MGKGQSDWLTAIKLGLIGGVIEVLLALIGMVEAFSERQIVYEIISMGHTLVFMTGALVTYFTTRKITEKTLGRLVGTAGLSGLIIGVCLALLVIVGKNFKIRDMFINASPVLFQMLIFGQELTNGLLLLILAGFLTGVFVGFLCWLPPLVRKMIVTGLVSVAVVGVLQDLLKPTFSAWGPLASINDLLFDINGLKVSGAIGLIAVMAAGLLLWAKKGDSAKAVYYRMPPANQKIFRVSAYFVLAAILMILPHILGLFLSEVLTIVGLYVLLGLGLNIVVGFAGLLDLGYVAFFAIGSYTVAILTSPEMTASPWNFWLVLPLAVALGAGFGAILGVPVLNMRGDYLAITTLGFGEIIRIFVLSDFFRPWLGGAQGIGKVPKITIGSLEFGTPQTIYYIILAGCLLVGFVSYRLRDSRLGRAWMAVREDEDVAQAMGINLVSTKLLAFATGAGFSALSGAIFATKLGSVYPHSFNVMISINILCLIIVGGMGSLPGVIVGSLALVGLPELLREFAEYRLLVYGLALMAMMLLRPEGLLPSAVVKREFHGDEEVEDPTNSTPAQAVGTGG